MDEKNISRAVIRRLPRYYRYLGELLEEGVYDGTCIYVYEPDGESEPFSAEESLVGLTEIEGPLVSVCSEVCC